MGTFITAVILAFVVGMITGAVGLFAIACRSMRKGEQNEMRNLQHS